MRYLLPHNKCLLIFVMLLMSLTGYSQDNTNACTEASKVFRDLSAQLKVLKVRLKEAAKNDIKTATLKSVRTGTSNSKTAFIDTVNIHRNLQLIDRAISNVEFLRALVDMLGLRVPTLYAANVECTTEKIEALAAELALYQNNQIIKAGANSVLGTAGTNLAIKVLNATTNPKSPFEPVTVIVRIPLSSWDGKSSYHIWYSKVGCDPAEFSRHCEASFGLNSRLISPPITYQRGIIPGMYQFWCVSDSGKKGRVEEKIIGGVDRDPIDLTPPR